MTVQQPRTGIDRSGFEVAIFVLAIASIRKVAQLDHVPFDVERHLALMNFVESGILVTLDPWFMLRSVEGPAPIVITGQQQLATVQSTDERERFANDAHSDITEYPDRVLGLHDLIPSLDKAGVHVDKVAKRAM